MSIRVYGKVLNALLDELVSGRTSKDKCLAPVCWRYNDQWLHWLLMGYLEGDGHWDAANCRWRLGFTRNYNLERDLRTLCARLDYHLVLKLADVGLNGKRFPSFRGEIRVEQGEHWNQKITSEIAEIRKARCREVYDIGVQDEPHLFALASGILTHNSKPNPMPESVTDRPTKAHEYIFLLTKSPRYFYDADAIRETATVGCRDTSFLPTSAKDKQDHTEMKSAATGASMNGRDGEWSSTRNRRSVWTVPTESYEGAHYATFPTELIAPCILAGTSQHGVCPQCGKPWIREIHKEKPPADVFTSTQQPSDTYVSGGSWRGGGIGSGQKLSRWLSEHPTKTTGWKPQCIHIEKPIPALVLDPFAGSGTTGEVCRKTLRNFVGLDISLKYLTENALPRAEQKTAPETLKDLPMFELLK